MARNFAQVGLRNPYEILDANQKTELKDEISGIWSIEDPTNIEAVDTIDWLLPEANRMALKDAIHTHNEAVASGAIRETPWENTIGKIWQRFIQGDGNPGSVDYLSFVTGQKAEELLNVEPTATESNRWYSNRVALGQLMYQATKEDRSA